MHEEFRSKPGTSAALQGSSAGFTFHVEDSLRERVSERESGFNYSQQRLYWLHGHAISRVYRVPWDLCVGSHGHVVEYLSSASYIQWCIIKIMCNHVQLHREGFELKSETTCNDHQPQKMGHRLNRLIYSLRCLKPRLEEMFRDMYNRLIQLQLFFFSTSRLDVPSSLELQKRTYMTVSLM